MNTDPVVEVDGLVKSFGRTRALDGLSLRVGRGEVAGFLGPNGAGKSTTIRVLLGLVHPDAGTVRVFGADPVRDAVAIHRRLAYVPGDVALWPRLTGGECIDLLLGMRGVTVSADRRSELLDRFRLDPTRRVSTYSKGNRQKVVLVAAFAAPVDLLVLDEPTSGLDPVMETVFADCVREAVDTGSSVLLSSHILSEVEKLCDSVTIVRDGATVEAGALSRLRRMTRLRVSAEIGATGTPVGDGIDDLQVEAGPGGRRRISFLADRTRIAAIVAGLDALDVTDLTVTPPSLEELFLRYYGGAPAQESL
ncbi:ABC transporter ATP-binding protein [uncultured Williamsia sp.]|uniref:ABC transporter ATP-binding protein n=1 Tax=uncultured Williamsia sp. TaxID=259311 RepID=UPI00261A1C3D|nr:ABC transporter ATP-binding protein [uncultured Williamsia sp.]